MTNTLRVAPVEQMFLKVGDHTAIVEVFTQQGTALAGGALAAYLDADRPIGGGRHGGNAFAPSGWYSGIVFWRNALNSLENTIGYLCFPACLVNISS